MFIDKGSAVQDSNKCSAQVKVDDMSRSSHIHLYCNPVSERHQIGQAWFALN